MPCPAMPCHILLLLPAYQGFWVWLINISYRSKLLTVSGIWPTRFNVHSTSRSFLEDTPMPVILHRSNAHHVCSELRWHSPSSNEGLGNSLNHGLFSTLPG